MQKWHLFVVNRLAIGYLHSFFFFFFSSFSQDCHLCILLHSHSFMGISILDTFLFFNLSVLVMFDRRTDVSKIMMYLQVLLE